MLSYTLAFILALGLLLTFAQASALQQTTLQARSDQGAFKVKIEWTKEDIGNPNAFDIHFIDPDTGLEIEDVTYDFSIYLGDHREILRRDQTATHQEFTFDRTGSYQIMVDDIDGLGEKATIPVQVTPEFPTGVIAIVAVVIAATIFVGRQNNNDLFKKRTK